MGGEETILPYRRIPISECRMNEGNRKSLSETENRCEIHQWTLKLVSKSIRRNRTLQSQSFSSKIRTYAFQRENWSLYMEKPNRHPHSHMFKADSNKTVTSCPLDMMHRDTMSFVWCSCPNP